MMYSKRRSLRIFSSADGAESGEGCCSALAESLERIVIQASLSHSVIASESNDADFVEIPALWETDLSIALTECRIRSIEAWNSDFRMSGARRSAAGNSKCIIASSSTIGWKSSSFSS